MSPPTPPITNLYLNGGHNINNNNNKTVKFKLEEQPKQFITTLIGSRQVELKEIKKCEDGRVEKLLEDGTILTEFANGTLKEVSSNKRHTFVNFYNGDRKEMNLDASTETYYYAQTNVTQITYTTNGLQVFKFPNGQIEKHYSDKTKEIIFPDKVVKIIYPNGTEESRLTNGTIIKVENNGDKIIEYSNKQREIHTKDYKRREYPDGSVKTVYSNGMTETRYANGRIRVKDEFGNIISDKKQ
jgi:centromere protein J